MKSDTVLDYRDRIIRVLHHVHAAALNAESPPSPGDLAAVACFSRFHFHRVFSAMVGESAAAHVRRIYLERAALQLRESDKSVIDVAFDAGYGAHESFTRAFAAHFGCAPRDYRSAPETVKVPVARSHVHFGDPARLSRFVPLTQESSMLDVTIESAPARRLAAIAHQGPYPEIGGAFGRVFAYAGKAGLFRGPVESIGIYYDDPDSTAPTELRSHACLTAPADFTGDAENDIEVIELPHGECAVAAFKGPYSGLHAAWRWLYATWLPSSGREPSDQPPFELYLNDPKDTKPEELLTAIHIPLKPTN